MFYAEITTVIPNYHQILPLLYSPIRSVKETLIELRVSQNPSEWPNQNFGLSTFSSLVKPSEFFSYFKQTICSNRL